MVVLKFRRCKWTPAPSLVEWLYNLESYQNETVGQKEKK